MKRQRHSPGLIRDAIIDFLASRETDATVADVRKAVENSLGTVPASSIRSYLRLRPDIFFRTHRGRYKMQLGRPIEELFPPEDEESSEPQIFSYGKAHMVKGDCFKWLEDQPANSIEAVVTDPPYGLVEYSPKQQAKLIAGIGEGGGGAFLHRSMATSGPRCPGSRPCKLPILSTCAVSLSSSG